MNVDITGLIPQLYFVYLPKFNEVRYSNYLNSSYMSYINLHSFTNNFGHGNILTPLPLETAMALGWVTAQTAEEAFDLPMTVRAAIKVMGGYNGPWGFREGDIET